MADIYTPKIKVDENGSVQDLNLNAYAVQGKVPSTETTANTLVARDNSGRAKILGNIDSPIQLSNVDLNTYNTIEKCGYYWCSSGSNVSNRPVTNIACSFHIFRSATGDIHQVCYTDIDSDTRIYFRKYIVGRNWTEWKLVATADDLEEFYSKTEVDDKFVLKEDITGDINVSIECDHEFEITGKTGHEYAVAIPDGQVLIKRINGQTRRKSLNLLDPSKTLTTNVFSYSNGVYTATNPGNGNWLINEYTIHGHFTIALVLKSKPSTDTTFTFYNITSSGETILGGFTSINTFNENKVYVSVCNSLPSTNLRIAIWNNGQAASFQFQMWIVEGEYTAETMPPFEPYDDTLVNSKCNLKSTSRNLLKITEQRQLSLSGVNITIDADTITMNGTATASNNFLISTQGFYINGTYLLKAFIEQGSVSGYPSIWLLAEDGTYTAFGINGVEQSYSINYKVKEIKIGFTQGDVFNNVKFKPMLVYGSTALTEYEPYEESSMLVDKELGEYDYIDNVGHLLVKQTSEVITLDGSDDENWGYYKVDTGFEKSGFVYTHTEQLNRAIVTDRYNSRDWNSNDGNIALTTDSRFSVFDSRFTTLEAWKAYLQSNPLQFVHRKKTSTTEPIQLEAGYQVWNSGLQIQETETIPYVLEKEYAVSLYSQILAVTSIVNSIPDDVATREWTDANYIPTVQKGQADGVVPLNSKGKIDSSYLPPSEYVQKYAHHLTFKRIVEEDNQILVFITFTVVTTRKDKFNYLTATTELAQWLNTQGFNSQDRLSLAQGVWREGNTNNYLSVFGVYGTIVQGLWKTICVGITKNTADVATYSPVSLDFKSDIVVPL